MSRATWPMIKADGKEPKLKSKASEGRHMLFCIEFVLKTFFPLSGYTAGARRNHAELRLNCIVSLVDMYRALESWGRDGPGAVASAGRRFLMLYSELSNEALEPGAWQRTGYHMWKICPKFHMLAHTIEDQFSTAGNPREVWCYLDESETGAAATLAERCHTSTLHRVIIERHRCA